MTDYPYEYDIPGTPFWAQIEDAGEDEWIWTIWITDPDEGDALVEVERGSSSSEAEAKLDVETAATLAVESWGFNGE